MILTIKGADFSAANIGTLSTYVVSKSIGSGAEYTIPSTVEKNSSVEWTISLIEGYTFGTYTVTMGSDVITPTVNENVMTITIPNVTGNVRIVVGTINENTGEEDSGNTPSVPAFKDTITINVNNITKGVDILPTDTQYHIDNVAFSTRYWVGTSSQTDVAKRGIYYLDEFPFNNSEYLSCCINVEEAVAKGYTKLKVIKTNVNSTTDNSCYYNRRTSASSDWTVGKENDRISCPNNTEIAISGYKSIWFGVRKVSTDSTLLYMGESVTFKFIK